jgi:hypothetical protein
VLVSSGVVLCAWCAWASQFHRSSSSARIAWACSLVAVVVADLLLWQGRCGRQPGVRLDAVGQPWPRPGSSNRTVVFGVMPWVAGALVALTWDVLGLDTSRRQPHLTISALTQAYRPMNAATLLVWMLVGIGYGVARARAPVVPGETPPRAGAAGEAGQPHLLFGRGPVSGPALLLPASRGAGVVFWVGLVIYAVLVDIVARRSGGRLANAEEVVRFVTRSTVANVALVVGWMYAGYHLFAH